MNPSTVLAHLTGSSMHASTRLNIPSSLYAAVLAQEGEVGAQPEGEGGGAFAPEQVGGPPVEGARPACYHLQTRHSGCAGGVCTSAMHAPRIDQNAVRHL